VSTRVYNLLANQYTDGPLLSKHFLISDICRSCRTCR